MVRRVHIRAVRAMKLFLVTTDNNAHVGKNQKEGTMVSVRIFMNFPFVIDFSIHSYLVLYFVLICVATFSSGTFPSENVER